jgi:predicted transcriptional regulator
MKSLSDQLREAIRGCGMTRAELSRVADVPESGLSRFMDGQELRTGNVDKLCRTLGLALKPAKGRATKG